MSRAEPRGVTVPVHEGLVRLEDRSPKLWLTLENHLRQASLDACLLCHLTDGALRACLSLPA